MTLDYLTEIEKIEKSNLNELDELFKRNYRRLLNSKKNLSEELTNDVFLDKYDGTLDCLLILCESIIAAFNSSLLENNIDIFVKEFISKKAVTLSLIDPDSDLNRKVFRITDAAQTVEDSEKSLKIVISHLFSNFKEDEIISFIIGNLENYNNEEHFDLFLDLICTHPDKGRDMVFETFIKIKNEEKRMLINKFYMKHFEIQRDLFKKKKIRGISYRVLEMNLNLYELEQLIYMKHIEAKSEPIGKKVRRKLEELIKKYKTEIISYLMSIRTNSLSINII